MIKVVIVLYYIIFYLTFFYSLYFVITGFLGIIKKSKLNIKKAKKNHHFAILVPARNEGLVIGNLIDSLKELNYPKDKYDIYALVNNCTDDTEEIAKKHGAKIITCNKPTKTKGDVLKIAFEKLKDNKEIEAYIVFDADNIVHPDFVLHMNDALDSGYRVAEGQRDAKNPSDNWLAGSYALFYLFQNVFFNKARMAINGSSSINGTGFMVKKDIIDKDGFETYTLTEDVEFTGQCALKGEKIAYIEDAITYDEFPTNFKASWKQRRRWSTGVMACMGLYSPKLFINWIKSGKRPSLDMSLVYCGPVIQLLNFVNIVMLLGFKIAGIELHDIFSFFFNSGILFFVATYLLGILLSMFVVFYQKKKILPVISGIFLFLVFIATWIPINIVCLFKKQENWDEIKHDKNIKINDVMKS